MFAGIDRALTSTCVRFKIVGGTLHVVAKAGGQYCLRTYGKKLGKVKMVRSIARKRAFAICGGVVCGVDSKLRPRVESPIACGQTARRQSRVPGGVAKAGAP
mmetsp:Transcript_66852/g.186658  ORF Transcript_66852/g.186658 Transcript_66852/m.186658 type:complete len:102 (-) Transcript_66852:195-500(-)